MKKRRGHLKPCRQKCVILLGCAEKSKLKTIHVRNERPHRVSHSTVHPRPSLPLPGAASQDLETGEGGERSRVQTTMLFAFPYAFISSFLMVDQDAIHRLVLKVLKLEGKKVFLIFSFISALLEIL